MAKLNRCVAEILAAQEMYLMWVPV